MKLFILVLTFILSSCSIPTTKEKEYDYEDVSYLKIDINQLFIVAKPYYFVYIYCQTCYYCNLIKNDVVEYALKSDYPTYFLEYTPSIRICDSSFIELGISDSTNLCILGTPTLLEIKEGVLTNNIAGSSEILNFLKSY